ncbi:phenolic glucoside malonyltransferase 1 [Brachypodium distachyon]|uniref:Uncharacterized protein n=1 Tax=Brachypodium distachyon TaxID=15368 RepID=I1I159_BRADI|nr:phenolic glucoside malonyltransferase 1 [Brachypodium distachyon]KQJ95199.1 hypothetical protein BRADI_3g15710v3 [Brachypodium distachyon]|eukprot:XP_003571422.1 phenolic glucoside malonyltransferase 1 [Brachypodium distachyon]
MQSTTKIVEVGRVVAPATAATWPRGESSSLVKLSALDAPWLLAPLIQRVLLFVDGDGGQELPPFESMVASLRASLAATLARFPPLAGRIVFLPDTGDAAIDCSSDPDSDRGGVRFVVAESEDADAARLAGDADHDVGAFKQLVPELETGKLPAEALAVQVTRLKGGAAVGVAMHHAVVDGRSVWRFLEAWAAVCRGDIADATAQAPVGFDRAALGLPDGEELARSVLRKYAADLPAVAELPVAANLPRRTFTITTDRINNLKQRITDASVTSSPSQTATPSSFVAVTALAWASFVRSKNPSAISPDDDVYLFFLVDCRGRCGGSIEDYFGTCITGCFAKATARDLLADDGVSAAAAAVQEEVRRAAEDPLAQWDWMGLAWSPLPKERLVNVSGSTRFPAYEATDFGWGAPGRTELVTMNHGGQVVLVGGKGGGGGMQASVCMEPEYMEAFSSHFLNF